jgi:hypothetical protein
VEGRDEFEVREAVVWRWERRRGIGELEISKCGVEFFG